MFPSEKQEPRKPRKPRKPTGCLKKNRVLANMDMVDMMFLFCWFIIFFGHFLVRLSESDH